MLAWRAGCSRVSKEATCALRLAQLPVEEKQGGGGAPAAPLRAHPGPPVSALTSQSHPHPVIQGRTTTLLNQSGRARWVYQGLAGRAAGARPNPGSFTAALRASASLP